MASSFDIGVSLDELTCSVCFELYKEPIAFPCGHSFCRVCVEKYCKTREGDTRCVCPNCHEVFLQKTKLKKNVIIANFVEKIKLKKREVGFGVEVRNVEHGGVYINKGVKSGGTDSSCELCHGEAAKRCVPCELLCCEQHLKPHQHKGHKLVDPGVKIEEFICIEHGKPIQLYCKDDESLMCLMCMDGQHQDQKVVAVEIAHAELKGVLAAKYPHVSRSMRSVASQLQQVQEEEEQTEGSKDLLKRLEAMSDLKTTPLTVLDFSKEKNNLDMLIKLNKNFLEKILRPAQHVVVVELDRNNLRSLYGQTPSLDPNSAHPLMIISQDLRVATLTKTQHPYPEHPDRFDICPQVVSSESFSSGRHYWEVDVSIQLWFTLFSDPKEMASSSYDIGVSLDELTCSVCFELYEEPISLPCGHSFCCVCIEKYWESKEEATVCVCPNCHEVFTQKSKLKKNVIIAKLVEKIKLKKREIRLGVEVGNAEHCDVKVKKGVQSWGTESYCELCNGEAAKRCVPCEILCCEQHLKPHQQKGHKLVDLGAKIEEFMCTDHGKLIQLYCKDDESLMCLMCTGGQHEDHNVVAVEIAQAELRGVLAAKYPHVSRSMRSVASQLQLVQEEKDETEKSDRDAEDMLEEKRREVCQLVNDSVDLMKSEIKKRKMEKLSVLEKQREKLEQQMESLRQGKSRLQTALQELETISFLQGSKDLLESLNSMSDFQDVQIFSFATPLTVLDFSNEEDKLDVLIKLNKNFLEKMQLSAGYAFQSSRNSAPSFKFGAATASTVPVASRTLFFGETGDKPSNQPTNSFQFNAIPCFYISDGSQFSTSRGSTIKNRNIKKAVRRRK